MDVRYEAEALALFMSTLEALPVEARHRLVRYLVDWVGLPNYEAEIERRRELDRHRQRKSRDMSRDDGHVTERVSPAPAVQELPLESLEARAKAVLEAKDLQFLTQCPEPFRTQWLKDPDWWVSVRDGYDRLDMLTEASKCMSYVQGKFTLAQQQRLNLRERLRRWMAKSETWRENREERRAVRR